MNHPIKLRFTIEQYHQMSEAGVLDPSKKTELLNGEIIRVNAKGSPHEFYVARFAKLMFASVGDLALVRVQSPILLPPNSEPEPDISILRYRADEYLNSHPYPHEVLVALEIAASSLFVDRGLKKSMYAAAGLQHHWLFDVDNKRLEIYSEPFSLPPDEEDVPQGDYRVCRTIESPERLLIPGLDDVALDLAEIWR